METLWRLVTRAGIHTAQDRGLHRLADGLTQRRAERRKYVKGRSFRTEFFIRTAVNFASNSCAGAEPSGAGRFVLRCRSDSLKRLQKRLQQHRQGFRLVVMKHVTRR